MESLSSMDSSTAEEIFQDVVNTPNVFVQWWNGIDWAGIIARIVERGLYLLFLLLIYFIFKKSVTVLLDQAFNGKFGAGKISVNRSQTIYKIIENVMNYFFSFFLIYGVLSILGVPVSTLLAGAGIAGVAIGLGAQQFISDLVNGFFIILEGQYDVGDNVTIGEKSGTVVALGLRVTELKGFDGSQHFIPNHMIEIVSNNSRNDMRAMVDIRLYPETDFKKVAAVIEDVNSQLVPEHPEITSGPNITGLIDNGNGELVYRVIFYTLNGEQLSVQSLFLRSYVTALLEEGIAIPKHTFPLTK